VGDIVRSITGSIYGAQLGTGERATLVINADVAHDRVSVELVVRDPDYNTILSLFLPEDGMRDMLDVFDMVQSAICSVQRRS